MKNIWENDWRPELWYILGPKMTRKIRPLRPIFNIPLKVAQIDMYTKTDAKPVENFCENDQRPEFLLILEPKVATSKSICNEHVKQYWCETNENFLRKLPNTRILAYFGAPKRLRNWAFEAHTVHISESSFNEHIKQDWCESRGKFLTKYWKLEVWLTWGHKWPINLGLWGLSFTHQQK